MTDKQSKDVIKAEIARLREQIDALDTGIIDLVKARSELSAKIAKLKKDNRLPMVTGSRELEVFGRYASSLGRFGKAIATAILSRAVQPEEDLIEETPIGSPSTL